MDSGFHALDSGFQSLIFAGSRIAVPSHQARQFVRCNYICCHNLSLLHVEELENFKNTLNNYDDQAKLERARLKEEHHQCTQIDLNNKKNKALQDFVTALQEEPRDGNKILEAIQRFVKFCTQDRLHK